MNAKITQSPFSIFMVLFLSTLIFSCGNDDDENDGGDGDIDETPEFYVEEDLFPCPSEVIDLSTVNFQINQAYEYDNLIIGGGFNNMVIFNPVTDVLTRIDTLGVNQFLEYEGKLMICAEKGLYSLDGEQKITLEAEERCYSVLINSNGEFLMTSNDKKILAWNAAQGITAHTEDHQSNFIDLFDLVELSNGELWAVTLAGEIARFKDQLFLDMYDIDDIPMSEFVLDAPMFLTAYEDGAILVTKNGLLYQIFKYTNDQEWVTLFDSESAPSSDETTAVIIPSITDILIREDKLYVSTTVAGCKGFQVFDITKNELLSPEDYHPQFDTNFDSQCINGLDYGANGDLFTISNNQVLIYDCN